MKRTLIALGVIAATVSPLTAQANPKLYGKLNVTVQQNESENAATTEDRIVVQSNDSRFGIRGDAELSPTLTAVYGIEWAVAGTMGDANAAGSLLSLSNTDLSARNRFVGIKHQDLGTLKLGSYDTYLKLAQGKVDLFNDGSADMKFIVAGETRTSNAIGYESPKIAEAVTINVMLIPGEQSGVPGADEYNGLTDGISASVVYDNSDMGLYLALARDQEVAGNLVMGTSTAIGGARRDTTRLVASYKIADLTLGALYQISEGVFATPPAAGTAEEETAMLVSAAYKIDAITLKAQYLMGENDAAVANERNNISVGLDYAFTSKTRAYGFYSMLESETGPASSEASVFALGVEHNF